MFCIVDLLKILVKELILYFLYNSLARQAYINKYKELNLGKQNMQTNSQQMYGNIGMICKNGSEQIEEQKQKFSSCDKTIAAGNQKKQEDSLNEERNLNIIRYAINKNKLMEKDDETMNSKQSKFNEILSNNKIIDASDVKLRIKKLSGGVINDVYEVCKDYVIKIQNVIQGILIHQPQMLQLAAQAGVKCPKLVDYGSYDNKNYLMMTKIQGERLWRFWPLLAQSQKQLAIKQICEELKKLHSIKFQKYSPQRPRMFASMYQSIEYFNQQLKSMVAGDETQKLDHETAHNLRKLIGFVQDNKSIFKQLQNEPSEAVFVHNDLHFGNILYDHQNKHVTGLVDFDFSRQLTKDYELWHIIDVLHKPIKYVEEGQEPLWQNFKVQNQIKYFRKYYPELFQDKHHKLCTKIKIYLFDQMITMLNYGAIDLFNEKYCSFYQTQWLNDFLEL